MYHLKLNQIWNKIKNLNFRPKKNPNRAFMKELTKIESLLWSLNTITHDNTKHDKVFLDPLIDKLISKINSLMSKYC